MPSGRSMAETYGNFSSTGLSNVSAGVILTAVQIKLQRPEKLRPSPLKYWLICGPIYVLYKLTTGLAVGVAATGEQVVTSGLLRLMWPMMTLIMAVIMFGRKIRPQMVHPQHPAFHCGHSGGQYGCREFLRSEYSEDHVRGCLLAKPFVSGVLHCLGPVLQPEPEDRRRCGL